ncbi:zinc finger, C2H2 type, partial [Onchocerca flexuosa]
ISNENNPAVQTRLTDQSEQINDTKELDLIQHQISSNNISVEQIEYPFNLQFHNETHIDENSFKCNLCGQDFACRRNLSIHRKLHSNEKKLFKCNICSRTFSRRYNVNAHKRIHTGEKPFKCNICGKKFSDVRYLSTHNKTHILKKPFKCIGCGYIRLNENSNVIYVVTNSGEKLKGHIVQQRQQQMISSTQLY